MGRESMRPCIYPALRRWMQKSGCGYEEVSRRTGLSNQTVSRTLSGQNATKRSIDLIIAVTGLTYEQAFSTRNPT